MKKNILAVAVVAAMVAPATSMAGASFYGHAQVELTQTTFEDSAKDSELGMADNARGRIGMKAVEDLGNGWKGLATFEFKADTVDGDATKGNADKVPLQPREHMVGLKGPMGQIELGRLKQGFKYTGGVKYDAFVTTALEARGNGGMSKKPAFAAGGHSSFHSNAIGYRKKFGPIKLSLTYGPSTDDGSHTLGVLYKKGGIEAFVASVDSGDTMAAGATYSAVKFGGKFKTGAHSIMLQSESISMDDGTGGATATTDPSHLFLAYQMKMGKNVFAINYGSYDADSAAVLSPDETYLALGVIHNFSKKTRVFAGYRSTASDDDSEESVITVGVRKVFKGG